MSYIYEKFIKESINSDGTLNSFEFNEPQNFNFAYDVVDELARIRDKRAMLWVSDKGEEITYNFSDMMRESNKTANYFRAMGINKGDKVMLILKRHAEFWFTMLALHKLGAIAIPASFLLMEKDLVYRFNVAEVKAIVCTSDGCVADEVEKSLPKSPSVKLKFVRGEKDGWLNLKDRAAYPDTLERVQTDKNDIMLMYFTSGTTGFPKVAAHKFTYALGHFVTAKWWHNVKPDGLHFTFADTGWGKAVWGKLYGQWLAEAGVFTYDFDKFEPHHLLALIEQYKITTFCAPPTVYRFFIKEDLTKYDLSSLEYATIAGEALNPEVFRQFKQATGLSLMEGFGQTETTLVVGNLVGTAARPGSMGKPTPLYEVRIVRPDDGICAAGEVGEIVINIASNACGLFAGYYNAPEQTANVCVNGWYHTGDMAWQDEDGYFWYEGRADDLIKSSGYRIGPFEIESTLMEHPAVLECAVTGVPDAVRGQVVKATIVTVKGVAQTEELKKEIQDYVKSHTAPYKYPRIVEFVDELPKTTNGKIRRVELRDGKK